MFSLFLMRPQICSDPLLEMQIQKQIHEYLICKDKDSQGLMLLHCFIEIYNVMQVATQIS